MIEFFDQYYLPIRLLACFFIGFWWSSSGSLLQWSTQNPLSCPVTLGLTALPILTWLIAVVFTPPVSSWEFMLTLLAFFSLVHLFVAKKMATSHSQVEFLVKPQIILGGLALNLTLASIFSFLHFYYNAQGATFPSDLWFGFLKNMDITRFLVLLTGSVIFALGLNSLIKELSKLSLGLTLAKNICDIPKLEKRLLLFVSLLVCFLVIVGGVFSFWGLVLPHLLRKFNFFRSSLSREVWLGSSLSGLLMLLLDYFCYQYPISGSELPVGLLSSVLGPILLLMILFKRVKH